jgi:protein-S-isoprenylcysteine O-methyltransferase Ste14
VVARRHPDLIRDRANTVGQAGVKTWDQWLAPLMAFGSLLPPVLAALERLWGQPPVYNVAVNLIGVGAIILGYLLGTVAMLHNRFFTGQVRIQRDRGHHVVSSGPYRVVRHPGYSGSLLANPGVPLLLDSVWAWAGVAVVAVITVTRTALEDRTLQAELAGYPAYARRVRYRLLPWIW